MSVILDFYAALDGAMSDRIASFRLLAHIR
jgi:hypothetical protein